VSNVPVNKVRRVYSEGELETVLNRKKPDRIYEHRLDSENEAHLIALVPDLLTFAQNPRFWDTKSWPGCARIETWHSSGKSKPPVGRLRFKLPTKLEDA